MARVRVPSLEPIEHHPSRAVGESVVKLEHSKITVRPVSAFRIAMRLPLGHTMHIGSLVGRYHIGRAGEHRGGGNRGDNHPASMIVTVGDTRVRVIASTLSRFTRLWPPGVLCPSIMPRSRYRPTVSVETPRILAASPGVIISLIVSPFEVERSRFARFARLLFRRVENWQGEFLRVVFALGRE